MNTVKRTNYQLLVLRNILMGDILSRHLPQKLGYAIAMLNESLMTPLKCYADRLNAILKRYEEYFMLDENGKKILDERLGIPMIEDAETQNIYLQEVNELLQVETEISVCTVDETIFDYDDEKYDPVTAGEIIMLKNVLCK